jgi:hypothetical protein
MDKLKTASKMVTASELKSATLTIEGYLSRIERAASPEDLKAAEAEFAKFIFGEGAELV